MYRFVTIFFVLSFFLFLVTSIKSRAADIYRSVEMVSLMSLGVNVFMKPLLTLFRATTQLFNIYYAIKVRQILFDNGKITLVYTSKYKRTFVAHFHHSIHGFKWMFHVERFLIELSFQKIMKSIFKCLEVNDMMKPSINLCILSNFVHVSLATNHSICQMVLLPYNLMVDFAFALKS